jgi:hypothetical protein
MPTRLAIAGFALVAVICTVSLSQFGVDRTDARRRALDAAKTIAQRIDTQLRTTETLLNQLSVKLSTNPDDVAANDALLRRELSEVPKTIANILLLSPDGRNIGNAVGNHTNVGDREYFKRASAGDQLVVEAPIRSRSDVGWVIPIARRMSDGGGSTQAVLVIAISVDSIREASFIERPLAWAAKRRYLGPDRQGRRGPCWPWGGGLNWSALLGAWRQQMIEALAALSGLPPVRTVWR